MKISLRKTNYSWMELNIEDGNISMQYDIDQGETLNFAKEFFGMAYDLITFKNNEDGLCKLLEDHENDRIIDILKHRAEQENNEDLINAIENIEKFL